MNKNTVVSGLELLDVMIFTASKWPSPRLSCQCKGGLAELHSITFSLWAVAAYALPRVG